MKISSIKTSANFQPQNKRVHADRCDEGKRADEHRFELDEEESDQHRKRAGALPRRAPFGRLRRDLGHLRRECFRFHASSVRDRVKRILILGGGFAAISAARKLEKMLRPGEATVDLVSRENFSVFTPMLPEVSSGGLEPRHISTPVRAELRHTNFYLAEVGAIDLKAKCVTITSPITETSQRLEYDQLVLCLGSVTSTFNLPGIDAVCASA